MKKLPLLLAIVTAAALSACATSKCEKKSAASCPMKKQTCTSKEMPSCCGMSKKGASTANPASSSN